MTGKHNRPLLSLRARNLYHRCGIREFHELHARGKVKGAIERILSEESLGYLSCMTLLFQHINILFPRALCSVYLKNVTF